MAVIMHACEGDAERCSPWGLEPGRLWSLWDVIEKYAALFTHASKTLISVEAQCTTSIVGGRNLGEAAKDITQEAKKATDLCRIVCGQVGMAHIIPEINRVEALVNATRGYEECSYDNMLILRSTIKHLINRIHDELESEFFFHVKGSDLSFYGKKDLLGPLVSRHFPNSTSDIEAAGNCLALRQPTACVFHLMRVMEKGTQTLGRKLKVAIDPEIETWNKVLDHVDKQIKLLSTGTAKQKAKKAAFAQVSSYLHQVKIAWRNEVMHPKATYTQEEARDIFAASRTFMIHLSEVL